MRAARYFMREWACVVQTNRSRSCYPVDSLWSYYPGGCGNRLLGHAKGPPTSFREAGVGLRGSNEPFPEPLPEPLPCWFTVVVLPGWLWEPPFGPRKRPADFI